MNIQKLAENAMLRLSKAGKNKALAASKVNAKDIEKYLDAMENRIVDDTEYVDVTTGFFDDAESGVGEFIWHDAPRNAKEFIAKAMKEASSKVSGIKDAKVISEKFDNKDYKVEIQFA